MYLLVDMNGLELARFRIPKDVEDDVKDTILSYPSWGQMGRQIDRITNRTWPKLFVYGKEHKQYMDAVTDVIDNFIRAYPKDSISIGIVTRLGKKFAKR